MNLNCSIFRNMSKYSNEELQRYAAMFAALSNPNRLRMVLEYICRNSPGEVNQSMNDVRTCLGIMRDEMELVPSTISHHLKELRQAGLINMERQGKQVACWVDKEVIEELSELFDDLAQKLD